MSESSKLTKLRESIGRRLLSEDGFLLTIAGTAAARSHTNCPYRVTDAENRFGIARSRGCETAATDAPDSSC